eukprot:gene18104-91_t
MKRAVDAGSPTIQDSEAAVLPTTTELTALEDANTPFFYQQGCCAGNHAWSKSHPVTIQQGATKGNWEWGFCGGTTSSFSDGL